MKKNSCARVGQKKIMQAKSVGRSEFLINFSVVPMSLRSDVAPKARRQVRISVRVYIYILISLDGCTDLGNKTMARARVSPSSMLLSASVTNTRLQIRLKYRK